MPYRNLKPTQMAETVYDDFLARLEEKLNSPQFDRNDVVRDTLFERRPPLVTSRVPPALIKMPLFAVWLKNPVPSTVPLETVPPLLMVIDPSPPRGPAPLPTLS